MASTIWKGRLNFGLVSIPIKLSRAARAEKVHMHKLQRSTGSRVRQVFVPVEAAPEAQPEAEPDAEMEEAPAAVPDRSRVAAHRHPHRHPWAAALHSAP